MSIASERKRPFVIAVANGKGGVGKTTTALAVGTILARRGLKILFIDLDPQGNLTLALGYKPHRMPPPSTALPTAGTLLAKESFPTNHENIHLVYARSLIIDQDYRVQVNTAEDLYFLGQDLTVVQTLPYDYVIIDCPPSIGKIIANSLYASDFLIIPSQAEYFSANALDEMMDMIKMIQMSTNADLSYRILITLFDKRNQLHHSLRDYLRAKYGLSLFRTIIETDSNLYQIAIQGFPLENSRGVVQYRRFVDELMDIVLREE